MGKALLKIHFQLTVLSQDEYDEWVEEVQDRAEPITEKKFTELLEPGHLGRSTYTGTHLEFMPPPGEHSEHNQASTDSEESKVDAQVEHSEHNSSH